MQRILTPFFLFLFILSVSGQSSEPVEITDDWLSKIDSLAPSETTVKNVDKRKILVFSKATGFDHWTIPHNAEMLKILAKKTGAFEIHIKFDIEQFEKENLDK